MQGDSLKSTSSSDASFKSAPTHDFARLSSRGSFKSARQDVSKLSSQGDRPRSSAHDFTRSPQGSEGGSNRGESRSQRETTSGSSKGVWETDSRNSSDLKARFDTKRRIIQQEYEQKQLGNVPPSDNGMGTSGYTTESDKRVPMERPEFQERILEWRKNVNNDIEPGEATE